MGKTVINTLAASNHSEKDRSELDYYGTNPKTLEALLEKEIFDKDVWEPGSGHGNLVNVLKAKGYNVWSTDIHDYGCQDMIIDFLNFYDGYQGDIIMNPPYNLADEFVKKALSQVDEGHKVAALLRLQYLEGNKRYETILKDNPPKHVYPFVNRQVCSAKDDFTESSALAYAWFVWEKGFKGEPIIRWLKTK